MKYIMGDFYANFVFDVVGPEEEVIVTERETLEITEKPDEKEEIIIEQPEEKPIEKVEEVPSSKCRRTMQSPVYSVCQREPDLGIMELLYICPSTF